jgi:hypothetical protein
MPVLDLIAKFADVIVRLVAANGDAAKEEEALMLAAEHAKAELDRRKFGGAA